MERMKNALLSVWAVLAITWYVSGFVGAGTIVKPNTFSSGQTASASQVNANFDTIYSEFNGGIDAANIEAGGVATSEILDGTILSEDVGTGSILSSNVRDFTLTGSDLSSATITGGLIATSNITRDHLGSEEVLSVAIRNFTIVGGNGGDIASGTITGGNLATSNVSEDHLTTGSVASDELLDGGILVGDVRPGTLTGGNGGTLASATIIGGNIATDNVTQDHIASGSIRYTELNAIIDTVPYFYTNLVSDVGTATDRVTVAADSLSLKNPDDSTWIVIQSPSISCVPVSGAAALNAQATAYIAAAQRYFLWVGAKSDGTSPRACLSTNHAIATVQDEFVALDATYTYVGLYGAVLNTAAGSYTLVKQRQIGGHVSYLARQSDGSSAIDVTNQVREISDRFPEEIAHHVDLYFHLEDDGTSSTDLTLFAGDVSTTFFTAKALGDVDEVIPNYPTADGNMPWTLDVNGTGSATIYVTGYTINHLSR